jgi:hypothetical protein
MDSPTVGTLEPGEMLPRVKAATSCRTPMGYLRSVAGLDTTGRKLDCSVKLSAGSLGCGNDLVEAFITAQRIPARIEAEIAICRPQSGNRCDNFELLERSVLLACPRVNQRQVGSPDWTVGLSYAILNPRTLKCAARGALFFESWKSFFF